MLVILVSKIKQKLLLCLRLLLFGAMVILLFGQLWGIIQSTNFYSSWFKKNIPNGNPMRVEQNIDQEESGVIDCLKQIFKDCYQKEN